MRMNNEIDLWRLFFRIVERGSLTKAADDLNLEPSSVSRRLTGLEQRLNVQLLNRSTRRVTLTDAGARAYEQMRPLIDEMEGILADLDGQAPQVLGPIRVTAPVNFGERFVTQWLTAFQRAHPGVRFDLVLADSRLDLMAEGLDLALRIGEVPSCDLIARRIGSMPHLLCASPGYLAKYGRPQTPADLPSHRAILYSLARDRKSTLLRLHRNGTEAKVELNGAFFLNNVGAIHAAVLDGAGLHAGPSWLFEDAIASGSLEELLVGWRIAPMPVHLLRLKGRYVPRRVEVLVQWLEQSWREAGLPE
jgi:DNA-binding transcriptional LysR family regulator